MFCIVSKFISNFLGGFRWTALLLAACLPTQANGDIMFDVQDTSLLAGQASFVDVFVKSTGTDAFSIFNYEFSIQTIGTSVGTLRFVNPQSAVETSFSNYVFNGDSGAFSSVPQNGPAFNNIQGGDATGSFGDITLTTANVLLVRLEIEHVLPIGTPPSAAAADQFSISLQNTLNSFFLDSTLASGPAIDADSFGTVGVGLITINSVVGVPEPGSLLLVLASSMLLCFSRAFERHCQVQRI